MIFKCIFAFCVIGFTSQSDGDWSCIQQSQVQEEIFQEDPSIWTAFVKQFGTERVLVAFPKDPVYGKKSDGTFFARVQMEEGNEFLLLVQQQASGLALKGECECIRSKEGKFVFQKIRETKEHLYVLQVTQTRADPSEFYRFIRSFDLEFSSDFQR